MLSSYKNHLTENLTLTGGVDLRYYKGYHTEEIDDLLGGEFYLQTSPLAFQTKNQLLKVGDKFNYYSIGEIFWGGVFAQATGLWRNDIRQSQSVRNSCYSCSSAPDKWAVRNAPRQSV